MALQKTDAVLFDTYIFVDWSAANEPKTGADSIWIGEGSWQDGHFVINEPDNPPIRQQAARILAERLLKHVAANRRILVGLDFAYGYPTGFWQALDGDAETADWIGIWQILALSLLDNESNKSNRFKLASKLNGRCGVPPGPFWGCPRQRQQCEGNCDRPYLRRLKEGFLEGLGDLQEFRLVERTLRASNRNAFSAWQLVGAGAVGSQILTGIPRLHTLRFSEELAPYSQVWPFETGWQIPDLRPLILHAEIWPGAIDVHVSEGEIKDRAQVIALVRKAAAEDANGTLRKSFGRPEALTDAQDEVVRRAEGWILWADDNSSENEQPVPLDPALVMSPQALDVVGQTARAEKPANSIDQDSADVASWVYFANAEGIDLSTTKRLAQEHGWMWRSVHNIKGSAIANVTHLQPGDRIYLYYTMRHGLRLLVSGTVVNPQLAGYPPVEHTRAGGQVPAFGYWIGDETPLANYELDPVYNRFTGICIAPDQTVVNPGNVVRPRGNNALWHLEDCFAS